MRLLSLTFDLPLNLHEVAGFRAAVARAAGFEHELFHNHRTDGSVQYRYPLVQYRSIGGKAAILGFDDGGDAIYHWYRHANNRLFWNGAEHELRLDGLYLREYALRFDDLPHRYRLHRWLALNQRHYRDWQQLPGLQARTAALDRLLVAHLLTFCRAVGWRLPKRLEANIQTVDTVHAAAVHGTDLMAFDVSFDCNLQLPPGIGLGKGVSHGHGVVWP